MLEALNNFSKTVQCIGSLGYILSALIIFITIPLMSVIVLFNKHFIAIFLTILFWSLLVLTIFVCITGASTIIEVLTNVEEVKNEE